VDYLYAIIDLKTKFASIERKNIGGAVYENVRRRVVVRGRLNDISLVVDVLQ
jgi:hypothetical protein